MRKRQLAMLLSRLEGFKEPKAELEQYRTPGNVAAELLWLAASHGDIEGKLVADLGAGTGVLGIGAAVLGARKVYAVEKDRDALRRAEENAERAGVRERMEFFEGDVSEFGLRVNTVVMNPPFGSQRPHADRPFLMKAFEIADVVYSIHLAKEGVRGFVGKFAAESGFRVTHRVELPFEIPAQFPFHRKRIERVRVDVYRFERERFEG